MNNIIDYLAWRGDLSFDQSALNAVDFLIFAQLVHAPLERLSGGGRGETLSQMQATVYPAAPGKSENALEHSRYQLWTAAAGSVRFGSVTLESFAADFQPDIEKQFAAALFNADDVSVVGFRGTDATLVGWKEDFNMSFESPIPSQTAAADFVNSTAELGRSFHLCGHSKGGNLALYAAAMCAVQAQALMLGAYSFDGPGLDQRTRTSEGYSTVSSRLFSFVPESSIVGLLMGYPDEYAIIRSDSVSIWQHNPYYWHVLGPRFVLVDETTRSSQLTDRALHAFLDGSTPQDRRVMVDTLFQILNATGAQTLSELPRGLTVNRGAVLSALQNVPPSSYAALGRMLSTLASIGTDNLSRKDD